MAKAFPLLTVDPVGAIGDNAALMLHIRFGEMLYLARHIDDPLRITELHNMRIAAKRLRYTMELFLPYFEGPNAKTLSNLLDKTKNIQEMIGDIHDRDVRVPLISEFLREHEEKEPEIRVGLVRLMQQEAQERDRLYEEFLAYWTTQRAKYTAKLLALIGSAALSPVAEAQENAAGKEYDQSADSSDQ